MLLAVAIPVGLTFGVVTWALLRGRGRGGGLVLSALFGMLGAFIGGLAGLAIVDSPGRTALAVGTVVGAALASLIEALGFGPRPKRVVYADRAGVAVEQPDHGEPAKSVR